MVYKGYIYNKKLTQANGHTTWRCCEVLKTRCKAVVITKNNKLVAARRDHCHPDHYSRIGNRPLYEVEEELGDYIELKSNDPNLNKLMKSSHVELDRSNYKIFVPNTDMHVTVTNKTKFHKLLSEINKN